MPNNSGTSDALLAVGATAPAASKARGPQNVGAAYKGVADSQRMIEAFRCPMRGDMPARNAGKTRRFEGVVMRGHQMAKTSSCAAFNASSQSAAASIGANQPLQATHCRSPLGGELKLGGRQWSPERNVILKRYRVGRGDNTRSNVGKYPHTMVCSPDINRFI